MIQKEGDANFDKTQNAAGLLSSASLVLSAPQAEAWKFCCFGDDSHQRDARHSHHREDQRDAETAHYV